MTVRQPCPVPQLNSWNRTHRGVRAAVSPSPSFLRLHLPRRLLSSSLVLFSRVSSSRKILRSFIRGFPPLSFPSVERKLVAIMINSIETLRKFRFRRRNASYRKSGRECGEIHLRVTQRKKERRKERIRSNWKIGPISKRELSPFFFFSSGGQSMRFSLSS